MKAVRLHAYNKQPVVDEVPEPKIENPFDVIVKIGGAGVCRTDLHIILGQWDAAMSPTLPYVIGHENAGWVHEIGSAVTNVAVGDTVILHPSPTCGLCRACRGGDDAPLLLDPATGAQVAPDDLRLHLGKARLTRVNIDANGSICRGMLRHRYPAIEEA